MPSGVFPLSEAEISTKINELISLTEELKTNINALRADFRAHDHGDTASYAQAAITIRAEAATITGTETNAESVLACSDALPVAPS